MWHQLGGGLLIWPLPTLRTLRLATVQGCFVVCFIGTCRGLLSPMCSEVLLRPGGMGVCVRYVLVETPYFVWRAFQGGALWMTTLLTTGNPFAALRCECRTALVSVAPIGVPAKDFVPFEPGVRVAT